MALAEMETGDLVYDAAEVGHRVAHQITQRRSEVLDSPIKSATLLGSKAKLD